MGALYVFLAIWVAVLVLGGADILLRTLVDDATITRWVNRIFGL